MVLREEDESKAEKSRDMASRASAQAIAPAAPLSPPHRSHRALVPLLLQTVASHAPQAPLCSEWGGGDSRRRSQRHPPSPASDENKPKIGIHSPHINHICAGQPASSSKCPPRTLPLRPRKPTPSPQALNKSALSPAPLQLPSTLAVKPIFARLLDRACSCLVGREATRAKLVKKLFHTRVHRHPLLIEGGRRLRGRSRHRTLILQRERERLRCDRVANMGIGMARGGEWSGSGAKVR